MPNLIINLLVMINLNVLANIFQNESGTQIMYTLTYIC